MTPILHEARIKLDNLRVDIIHGYTPQSANSSSTQWKEFLIV
jgi:hypothetical protein